MIMQILVFKRKGDLYMIISKIQMKQPELEIVKKFFMEIQVGNESGIQELMSEACYQAYQANLDQQYEGYREFLNQKLYGEQIAKDAEKLVQHLLCHLYQDWQVETYKAMNGVFHISLRLHVLCGKAYRAYVEAVDYDEIGRCIMQDEQNLKEIIRINERGDMQEMERFAQIKQAPYLMKEMIKAIDQSGYEQQDLCFIIEKQKHQYLITGIQ